MVSYGLMNPQTSTLGLRGQLTGHDSQLLGPFIVPWTDGTVQDVDLSQQQSNYGSIPFATELKFAHNYNGGSFLDILITITFVSGQKLVFEVASTFAGACLPVIQPNPLRFRVQVANASGGTGSTYLFFSNGDMSNLFTGDIT